MTNKIELTKEETRTGMLISDKAQQLHSALLAVSQLENEYIAQLRAKYNLDTTWGVREWLNGLEQAEDDTNGQSNNQ